MISVETVVVRYGDDFLSTQRPVIPGVEQFPANTGLRGTVARHRTAIPYLRSEAAVCSDDASQMRPAGTQTAPMSAEDITNLIGANIRLSRRLLDWSQPDLVAAQEGTLKKGERPFDRRDLSDWENGHRRCGDKYLIRIGRLTGHSLGWFYDPHPELEEELEGVE